MNRMANVAEACARLQLELMREALDAVGRNLRLMLEAPAPDRLLRMRGEMLAAESRRMLAFAQRVAEFGLSDPHLREAARVVEESMRDLTLQSTGMWEAHLRASRQAIDQALGPQPMRRPVASSRRRHAVAPNSPRQRR